MKKTTVLFATIILILSTACKSDKDTNDIFGTTWELEYLFGPTDDINAIFNSKIPYITFNKETMKVEGNSGCNGYSADFTLKGKTIIFGKPEPSTMMYCGEGENDFISILSRVNKYHIDEEGKLNLILGDIPFLRFKKAD